MSQYTDHWDGLVKSAMRRAGVNQAAWYYVRTKVRPWNAKQYPDHYQTRITHVGALTDQQDQAREVLFGLDGAVDSSVMIEKVYERRIPMVIWKCCESCSAEMCGNYPGA